MSHKVLVLGGDGMAGSMLVEYLSSKGHSVISTTRRKTSNNSQLYFDANDSLKKLDAIISKTKPEFVINCIGILNQSAEEDHPLAVKVNSLLPQYIDSISPEFNFKFIHISTDCVFSGKKGQYKESDPPDAETFYGRSKALGEIREGSNLTLRTSIVGPDPNRDGIGLFNWFMAQKGQISGYSKAVWSGVTTLQLAKSIEEVFDQDISGLYHLVNNETIDKYSLLKLFSKYMKKDITINPSDDYVNDKSLVNTTEDPFLKIPSYPEMISDMSEWISKHRDMYTNISREVSNG